MYRRQFVSPLIKRRFSEETKKESQPEGKDEEADEEGDEEEKLASDEKRRKTETTFRTPLSNLQVPNYSTSQSSYFTILWRNQTKKKNKTWDGDGVLSIEGNCITLQDSTGKRFVSLSLLLIIDSEQKLFVRRVLNSVLVILSQ